MAIRWTSLKPRTVNIITILMIAVVSIVDYKTGPYLGFSLFYLIPVSFSTWLKGLRSGIINSVLSALCWLLAEMSSGLVYPSLFFPIWNSLIRLSIFLIVAYTIWRIQWGRKMQQDLINFIIHDLRTPLAAILLIYENMKQVFQEKKYTELPEMIDVGTVSGKRMASLIDSILDLSRLESETFVVQKKQFDLKQMIENVVKQVSAFSKQREISLKYRVDCAQEEIFSDYKLLFRVMVNILSNAIKVSPVGGCINLHIADYDNKRLAITIEDQGPGIAPEIAKNLFKPFVNEAIDKTDFLQGFGLGLAFCKLATEKIGGQIEVKGNSGKGTKFMLLIPKT